MSDWSKIHLINENKRLINQNNELKEKIEELKEKIEVLEFERKQTWGSIHLLTSWSKKSHELEQDTSSKLKIVKKN